MEISMLMKKLTPKLLTLNIEKNKVSPSSCSYSLYQKDYDHCGTFPSPWKRCNRQSEVTSISYEINYK